MQIPESDKQHEEGSRWVRPDPNGFWRRWLTSAPDDAAGVRRWLFWFWWTKPRSFGARARILVDLAVSPVFNVREAYRCVRKYGGKVVRTHGISPRRQFLDVVSLRFRSGLPPLIYYKYQLFSPDRRSDAHAYLVETSQLLQILMQRLPRTEDKAILSSKRAFEDWCVAHDLRAVRSLLEVDGDRVIRRTGPLPAADLFVKPTNWRQGKGSEKLSHTVIDGQPIWVARDNTRVTAEALEGYLKARSTDIGRPLIVQRCLVNHPEIRALGNGSLCTFRVMTVRDYPADAELLSLILRIGIGDALADNFDLGGIATMVDPQTGRCGLAIAKRGEYPVDRLTSNPDSGAIIEGREVPFWREAAELAVRAHSALEYGTPIVGWDVAVLEDGPVLVEGNSLPCTNIAQMPAPMALGKTSYARYLVSALRSAFGLTPGASLGNDHSGLAGGGRTS